MVMNAYLEPLAAVLEPMTDEQKKLLTDRAENFLARERLVTHAGIKTWVKDYLRDESGEIRTREVVTGKDKDGQEIKEAQPLFSENFVMQVVDVAMGASDPANPRRIVFGLVSREENEIDVYSFLVEEVTKDGSTQPGISFFVSTYQRAYTHAALSPDALCEEMRIFLSSPEEIEADDERHPLAGTGGVKPRTNGAAVTP
jgi:hypothetical protein